ncbi:hypothetical protein Droror1_Dr00004232 [Drosera rotundifolia]
MLLEAEPFSAVERLLSAGQKATDYRSPDDGIVPDHRPTNACTRICLMECCGFVDSGELEDSRFHSLIDVVDAQLEDMDSGVGFVT